MNTRLGEYQKVAGLGGGTFLAGRDITGFLTEEEILSLENEKEEINPSEVDLLRLSDSVDILLKILEKYPGLNTLFIFSYVLTSYTNTNVTGIRLYLLFDSLSQMGIFTYEDRIEFITLRDSIGNPFSGELLNRFRQRINLRENIDLGAMYKIESAIRKRICRKFGYENLYTNPYDSATHKFLGNELKVGDGNFLAQLGI